MVWFILDLKERNKMNEKNEKYFNHVDDTKNLLIFFCVLICHFLLFSKLIFIKIVIYLITTVNIYGKCLCMH